MSDEDCPATSPPDDTIPVVSFGAASSRVVIGPPGPSPKDITLAPPDDRDRLNGTRRFLVTLSNGKQFYGSPFPASYLSDKV